MVHDITVTLDDTTEKWDLDVWITNYWKSASPVAHALSKANKLLGLIRRCFLYLDCQLVRQLFTILVRTHLEYGNSVWHPQYKKDIELLESVQHRATRLVPGFWQSEYEERLRVRKLSSLAFRRLRGDLIEVYKLLHGIYRVDSTELLPLDIREGTATRRHSFKLQKTRCRTLLRANSFGMRIGNNWSSLKEDIVQAPSVNCFKNRFYKFCETLDIM
jgi:ribonucleases P/MRP protein subunit RPP40